MLNVPLLAGERIAAVRACRGSWPGPGWQLLSDESWKAAKHPDRPELTADNSEQTTAFMVLGLVAPF
jgi:hypothetical protein